MNENSANAIAERSRKVHIVGEKGRHRSFIVKTKPAKTRRFLIHCLGRNPRTRAINRRWMAMGATHAITPLRPPTGFWRRASASSLPTSALPMKAPRPRRAILDNRMLRLRGLDGMSTWQDALRAFIASDAEAPRLLNSPTR